MYMQFIRAVPRLIDRVKRAIDYFSHNFYKCVKLQRYFLIAINSSTSVDTSVTVLIGQLNLL